MRICPFDGEVTIFTFVWEDLLNAEQRLDALLTASRDEPMLQSCLVYINTLMIQQVLSQPKWMELMQPEDLRALTPLILGHVNPYDLLVAIV